jgi:cobalt/nickel transport system permease protein
VSATSTLPDWLAIPSSVVVPERRQHVFLRRTLAQAERLAATLAPDEASHGTWDPRVKLVSAVVVLVVLALLHSPWTLTAALAALLALSARHRVAGGLAAVATPVLVMTAVLVAPATLSSVLPGTVVLPLWPGTGPTSQGLQNAWILLSRVLACLAVAVLLTRTTSWLRLMAALRAIGVPAGFVLVATMAHRYLGVLLECFTDLLLARRSRSLGGVTGTEDRGFVGATVGALLIRSGELADEVHQAMVARGFTGRLRDPAPRPLRTPDVLTGLGCLVASGLLLWGDALVR